ncbi:carbohydrate ABC transporter permease, partial [Streptomyces roseolus]
GEHVARGRSRGTGNPRRAAKRSLATHWYAWAMVAPVVIVIGVIIGYPLVRGIYLSFTDANERNVARTIGVNEIPATYEFIGLDNYTDAITGSQFLGTLGWTVVWTVSCVAVTFALGLALANILNRKIAGRSVYRMMIILPWAVPGFVSVFAWRFLYDERRGLL